VLRKLAPTVGRFYASRTPATAEQYRRDLRGAGAFGSYAEALADSRVDAVVVATTPDTHRALTLEALDANKHVVVEKPAFLKAVDFDRVRLVEAHTGRRVMVAENYCYKPIARALRDAITSGALGDVRFLSLVAVKQQRSHGWRDDPAVAGGGALFEGGVHWVDLLANVGLEVASVQGYRPGPAQSLERSMLVVVRYTNGGVGTLMHSWEVPSPLQGLRISRVYGTEGAAAFESNGIFLQVTGKRRRLSFPGFRDLTGNSAMWTDFLDVIRTGREPVMTTARAQRGLEIVEQAYATAVSAPLSSRAEPLSSGAEPLSSRAKRGI
jgi:predicted dehydrogenase